MCGVVQLNTNEVIVGVDKLLYFLLRSDVFRIVRDERPTCNPKDGMSVYQAIE